MGDGAPRHPSLPAAPAGPAKSWGNWAQVPMCLVTGLLFEKLKPCQETLTSAFTSGSWSRAGGCPSEAVRAGRPVEGARGRNRPQQRLLIHPAPGRRQKGLTESGEHGPGLTPHQRPSPRGPGPGASARPTARPPGPCQLLGVARYPGGVSRGPVKTSSFLLKSEF